MAPNFDLSNAKRAEHVARAIEDRIIDLGWPVGQLIGSEQSLMVEHDASRGVLREAVRLLEHHGTAHMRRGPGGGLMVQAPSANAVRRSASLLLQYKRTGLASLMAARVALELTCFDLMMNRLEDPLVTGRLHAVLQLEEAGMLPHAGGFHHTLIAQSDNPALALFATTLVEMHGEAVAGHGVPQDPEAVLLDAETCRQDHHAVVDALIAGDRAGARAQLQSHLETLAAATLAGDIGPDTQVMA